MALLWSPHQLPELAELAPDVRDRVWKRFVASQGERFQAVSAVVTLAFAVAVGSIAFLLLRLMEASEHGANRRVVSVLLELAASFSTAAATAWVALNVTYRRRREYLAMIVRCELRRAERRLQVDVSRRRRARRRAPSRLARVLGWWRGEAPEQVR